MIPAPLSKRSLLALFLGLSLGLTPGLGDRAWASGQRFEAGSGSGAHALLEVGADPLRSMTAIPFRLELRSAAGDEIEDARVICDLTMPEMPMPENRVELRWREGSYQGVAVFTMAGAWRIDCDIESPALPRESFRFDLDRVLMK